MTLIGKLVEVEDRRNYLTKVVALSKTEIKKQDLLLERAQGNI